MMLGALAMALYLVGYTMSSATGDPFRILLWFILAFRYISPAFFTLVLSHYFVNITINVQKMKALIPLLVDTVNYVEPRPDIGYAHFMGVYIYFIWAWYAVLYPILIWWVFGKIGLYARINRAMGKLV